MYVHSQHPEVQSYGRCQPRFVGEIAKQRCIPIARCFRTAQQPEGDEVSQSLGIEHDADVQFVRSRPRNEYPTARRSSVLSRQEALRGDVGKGKCPGEFPTMTTFWG